MTLSRGSKVFLALLLFLVAMVLGGLYGLNVTDERQAEADEEEGEPVTVEIPEGASTSGVAGILAEEGVVSGAWSFRLSAAFDERASRIRPGTYELDTAMGTNEILDVLAAGEPLPDAFTVTVPEGLTVPATLERIADAEGSPYEVAELEEALIGVPLPEYVPADDLPEGAQPHEGLLYPATYEFFVDEDPQEVLGSMIAETGRALEETNPPGARTPYEILIIASIIEREVRVDDEREIVSSVIANRLELEETLQIDATVQYARGEHTGRLLFDDLEIDSAWNTYENEGLPPTPIANAGQSAIEAAANPADTGYRFYVVCDTETGEHVFAELAEQHQDNVARYRDIQDSGGRFCDDV